MFLLWHLFNNFDQNERNYPIRQIAIEGCLHGKLHDVYQHLEELQQQLTIKIDLLIICGDFQSLRDKNDLQFLTCPDKYKEMGSF